MIKWILSLFQRDPGKKFRKRMGRSMAKSSTGLKISPSGMKQIMEAFGAPPKEVVDRQTAEAARGGNRHTATPTRDLL